MNRLPHVMILAAAGSGKTFALTNRFIALLAAGAAPDRIVALTFTRKAAGEFFDGILRKLAEAATDDAIARRLAAEIGRPELDRPDFRRMLRAVADALHRLRLGTLDSFFARIARAFPLELGLTGDFEVLQPAAARQERRRVLQRLFARDGGMADAQRDFLEAFKRATFGAEEKQLGQRLDAFLDAHHDRFLEAPDGVLWGDAMRIWPEGQPWLREAKPAAVLDAFRRWAGSAAMEDKQRTRWLAFHAALETWSPGAPLPRAMEYIMEKALPAWSDLERGACELTIERKKQLLDSAGCAVLRDAVCLVAGGEIRRRLEITRGIHAVLAGYDQLHDVLVRRPGRLTFADVERLLRPAAARPLSREAGGSARLFLDYRLDAEFDHWLLDEFQDTSRGQWSVLKNLIDEVVQDAGGSRTFFCVGDVKQAIFAWREGDPRLMGEIRELYNRGQERPIITQPLDRSWRSGPAIIGMVNAVFGSAAIGELFPGRASAEWKRQWRDHTTAFPGRSGQAALLHAADAAERKKLTLDLLSELSPLDKGLTCAVLVQRNTEATELADYLRREGGIPAVAESDLRVCADNPAGAAMLALFQTAAHPGDRLAWEHVGMTPLGAALAAEGVSTPGELSMRLLAQVNAEGFERTAEYWLSRLERALAPGNRFARERARQFAAAAALFDATGRRSVDEFSAFMESHAVREPESAAVVRVMTIHKSKGLGFDVVIVPELEGTRIDEPRAGLIVQTDAAHEVQWLLDRPTALFVRNDPVLSRHLAEAEQDACYESLSLLYVALTRAKRALFVITEPTEGSSSRNFPRLLGAALGESGRAVRVGNIELTGAWSAGEPDWHHNLSPTARMKDAEDSPPVSLPPAPRRVARRPSGEEQGRPVCGAIFDLHGHDAREFGTAVHRLLAEVEWCEPSAVAALGEGWLKSGAPREAVEHATRVLLDSSLADLWHPPAKGQFGAIWRERAFEVVMEDAWISGVIDRVRVQLDGTGRPARAWVWDFKTDAVPSGSMSGEGARRHASQLLVYRRVVARLTGLPVESVQAELVYTSTAQRVSMVTEG